MKRYLAWFALLAVLLTGCAKSPAREPETSGAQEETSPYAILSNYDPDALLEADTGGAIGVFPLEAGEYYAVAVMGEDILLFSGETETKLTALGAQGTYCAQLDCYIHPEDANVQVTEKGLGYYDQPGHALVLLDGTLQETARITMPDDLKGELVLTSNWEQVYYFSDSALRCLEVGTGISRMLKESSLQVQDVTALHFGDSLLECSIFEGNASQTMFVSTQTGEVVYQAAEYPFLSTGEDTYFAQWYDGAVLQNVFGKRGGTAQRLVAGEEDQGFYTFLQCNGVACCESTDDGYAVDFYDLNTGTHSASLQLPGVHSLRGMTEDAGRGLLWFLGSYEGKATLYCWNRTLSPSGDTQDYTAPFYTDEEPDTEGLMRCMETAQEMGSRYRVKIRIWEDATEIEPEDFDFTAESRVSLYEKYLPVLETALSVYPEKILKTLGEQSDNGYLTISLVRAANGVTELGSLSEATGVFFWLDGSAYITVVLDEEFEQSVHHELFHAIDSYVLTETRAYDFWGELNPEGFAYDLSYLANQNRQDWEYLEDAERSFIDMYSMSFPKEDRARIMQYAVTADHEEYFASKTMQKKLKTLCSGIREAFGLKDTYLWEQYLEKKS